MPKYNIVAMAEYDELRICHFENLEADSIQEAMEKIKAEEVQPTFVKYDGEHLEYVNEDDWEVEWV